MSYQLPVDGIGPVFFAALKQLVLAHAAELQQGHPSLTQPRNLMLTPVSSPRGVIAEKTVQANTPRTFQADAERSSSDTKRALGNTNDYDILPPSRSETGEILTEGPPMIASPNIPAAPPQRHSVNSHEENGPPAMGRRLSDDHRQQLKNILKSEGNGSNLPLAGILGAPGGARLSSKFSKSTSSVDEGTARKASDERRGSLGSNRPESLNNSDIDSGKHATLISGSSCGTLGSGGSQLSEFALNVFSADGGNRSRMRMSMSNSKVWAQQIHFLIEDPDRTSSCGRGWMTVMPLLVISSVLSNFAQSIEPAPFGVHFLRVCDAALNCVFIIEFFVRFAVYPKTLNFFRHFSSSQFFIIIDFFSAIPFWALMGFADLKENDELDVLYSFDQFVLLCVVPQIRLLKMLRYIPNFQLLSHSAILLCEAIPSMVFVMIQIMWFFSSLLMLYEPPDNILSLPHAMWLSLATMTTVGYGDVTPSTVEGYIILSALVILSVLYMAMPLGIVGSIFTSVWKDRDRILLMKKTRMRLGQWGYSATDIPELFSKFDEGGAGELDIFAFRQMIDTMNIGFDEQRIETLFRQMDMDGGGTIDAPEFIRMLFPKEFHEIYGGTEHDADTFSQQMGPTESDDMDLSALPEERALSRRPSTYSQNTNKSSRGRSRVSLGTDDSKGSARGSQTPRSHSPGPSEQASANGSDDISSSRRVNGRKKESDKGSDKGSGGDKDGDEDNVKTD